MSLNSLQDLPSLDKKVVAKTDIYTDLKGLQNLKSSARRDAKSALPEVARQFEAVMISMMIKNLRKTGMEDPFFKSQAMDSYRDMYDQQLGMELSKGQGIGFAKTIVEQMQYQANQQSVQPENNSPLNSSLQSSLQMPQRRHFPDLYSKVPATMQKNILIASNQASPIIDTNFKSPEHFVKKLRPLAEQTAQKLKVSAEIILSQAALETGWGKSVISNGTQSSFNLFNIKADASWQGKRIDKVSMEFIRGEPTQQRIQQRIQQRTQQQSSFRAYDSFEQSFNDYAHFIQNNPRYKTALQRAEKVEQSLHDESYIKAIHKAGYATDPAYSDKILRVLKTDAIQNQQFSETKLALK